MLVGPLRPAGAQTWNDPRSRALVEGATRRRAEQLADTGLTDYRATAHGYVTLLAQLGQGFLTPPKVIKADELELEVYWHAPNLSKQIIVGRRDTLLFPTDIAYHRDHLGIVQNNFPDIIRIGEGDEVRDVPHPLSSVGLRLYDFALADSFAIGSGSQRIRVYEVKVRPKDDRQPRVVGAVYIDPAGGQVVRMNFSFTRAALLDASLEDLSVVLENRLVGGRFWLPSRQQIEIRRTGTWLDYPVRGIIRGRWEIGAYRFNTETNVTTFVGPEIMQLPQSELRNHPWTGAVLDSLPPDVRAVTDEEVKRVQEEARELVRAQSLARPRNATLSAGNVSDLVRFNRVEGLAVGDGVSKQLGAGFEVKLRGRYGIDDHDGKGTASFEWQHPSGFQARAFGLRDFRNVGDEAERSSVVNSLAAQEFASDYTDPYLARGGGVGLDFPILAGLSPKLTATYETQSTLAVHAHPVTHQFTAPTAILPITGTRLSAGVERPTSLWVFGTELSGHVELRATLPHRAATALEPAGRLDTYRLGLLADIERPVANTRFVSRTIGVVATAAQGPDDVLPQEDAYFGGPVSAPGYDYHSLVSNTGFGEHIEWRFPAPFIPFSLGRFGRVPAQGTFAPYAHLVGVGNHNTCGVLALTVAATGCSIDHGGLFPSIGAAYVLPFDLLRVDVARGLGHGGRWTFNVDLSKEFWSIL
jgi:hypothetical protein